MTDNDNIRNTVTNRCEKYRSFFTKEYLMGPNSLRLLNEMLAKYPLKEGSRVMDLGCGMGITSMFLAKEANVNVFATDLWISATQNAENFKKWNVEDRIIPIHADANDLPYAHEYFDTIVSIDAFHYFGNEKNYSNIDKGRPRNQDNGMSSGFREILPLLDAYVPRVDKKA